MPFGGTRIIEYQIVSWADLSTMGNFSRLVEDAMGTVAEVGILRCVTQDGRRLTFVGEAAATEELVKSGAASNPEGISIAKKPFPIMLAGWPHRLRLE
jgi:hypothetical protein